jgi:hypothetical protein
LKGQEGLTCFKTCFHRWLHSCTRNVSFTSDTIIAARLAAVFLKVVEIGFKFAHLESEWSAQHDQREDAGRRPSKTPSLFLHTSAELSADPRFNGSFLNGFEQESMGDEISSGKRLCQYPT